MMHTWIRTGATTLLILTLAACSSTGDGYKKVDKDQAPPAESATPMADDAQAQGLEGGNGAEGAALSDAASGGIPEKRIIHFAYDRSDVRNEDRPILDAHAKYLSANPDVSVRLEGHADERGSREYNLALGERRALAVQRYLNILGVAADKMATHSYGEEYAIDAGHNEAAWQLNRRVEIIYTGANR